MNWTTESLVSEGAQRACNVVRLSLASLWLRPNVWVIFSRIIFLSAHNALRKRQLRRSCFRSRQYFKDAFELNVSTISEITTELEKLGFISKLQPRPVNGEWQVNMYKLEGIIWGKVKAVIIEFFNKINRVALRRHLVTKDLRSETIFKEKSDFSHKLIDPGPVVDYEKIYQEKYANLPE